MSDVKRSLLDMSPGGKAEDEEEPSEDELIESDETFAEFCSRKWCYSLFNSSAYRLPFLRASHQNALFLLFLLSQMSLQQSFSVKLNVIGAYCLAPRTT